MKIISDKDVEAFCEACIFFKIIYDYFDTLYQNNDIRLRLLEESAHHFFVDMQHVLIEFLFLQICKITDPATTKVKKEERDNLTIHFLLENTDLTQEPEKALRLQNLSKEIHEFRKKILGARNRRISHFDRDTALQNLDLGGFKYGEFEMFLTNLQDFINLIHDHYIGGPCDIGSFTEGYELIRSLKQSQYFQSMLDIDEAKDLCNKVRMESEFKAA